MVAYVPNATSPLFLSLASLAIYFKPGMGIIELVSLSKFKEILKVKVCPTYRPNSNRKEHTCMNIFSKFRQAPTYYCNNSIISWHALLGFSA